MIRGSLEILNKIPANIFIDTSCKCILPDKNAINNDKTRKLYPGLSCNYIIL